ncbi:MAG TPA: phosphatidylserine/phosphatidylglycerophosphate/cardiolipin synthase family protein, partial [Pyrinomonadaceae bacterium]
MVVDGSRAILGGINWGDKYAYGGIKPKAWRDTDVYLTGPVVADIQRQFNESFFFYQAMEGRYGASQRPGFDRAALSAAAHARAADFLAEKGEIYFPPLLPTGGERVRYVPHKPYDEERLPLTEANLLMFRQARKHIYWGCHGIRPPRIIAETLAEAAARGVEVRLITNSRKASQTLMGRGLLGFMYRECAGHFRWLIEHGIRVFEWQKPGAFHSKNLVIDDVVASVGSYNIANGSTFHHTESNVIVYGGDFPRQVSRQFDVDLADCREVPLAEAKVMPARKDPFARPLHQRYLLLDRSLLTDSIRRDLDAMQFTPT